MDVEDWPPLIDVGDLAGFRGAPFPAEPVTAAAESVRRAAGWHIAPQLEETVLLDHDGGRVLNLRSLYVKDVLSVRDMTGREPRVLTGWRKSRNGMLSGSFPAGFEAVEVTFVHGYTTCPADLLPVIADRTRRRVAQESLGGRSVTYIEDRSTLEPALQPYVLGPRP